MGISQHSYYICQFTAIFRWYGHLLSLASYTWKRTLDFLTVTLPPFGGQIQAYQVDQLLETTGLDSQITPAGIMGCDLYTCLDIHVWPIQQYSGSLKLPTHWFRVTMLFMDSLSLINTSLSLAYVLLEVITTIRLYPSCNLPHRCQWRSFGGE